MGDKKRRLSDIVKQFMKFSAVGVSNTAISLGVYYIFYYIGFSAVLSNALGFVASVINAFYWNNKYVFKNSAEEDKKRAFIKVFVSYGLSFLISTVLIWVMVDFLDISGWIAPLLRLVITTPINFLMNKLWAFKDK